MLYFYDKALTDKFINVFDESRVIYTPVDQFYDRYFQTQQDISGATTVKKLQLPAISIWRINQEIDWFSSKSQLRIPNIKQRYKKLLKESRTSSIKCELTYQIDIWANTDIDRDDMFAELAYFISLYPNIRICFGKGIELLYPCYFTELDNTTDIASFESVNKLYRYTLNLIIPDARLLYVDGMPINKAIKVDIKENEEILSSLMIEEQMREDAENNG
jgi:hypothetical protein